MTEHSPQVSLPTSGRARQQHRLEERDEGCGLSLVGFKWGGAWWGWVARERVTETETGADIDADTDTESDTESDTVADIKPRDARH